MLSAKPAGCAEAPWETAPTAPPQGLPEPTSTVACAKHYGWRLAAGVLLILLGVAAVGLARMVALAAEILVGWILLFAGIAQTVQAFGTHYWRPRLLAVLYAAVYFAAGVMMLTFPLGGVLTLTLLLAAAFVVGGVFKISMAWQLRTAGQWGWLMLSGFMAVLLGALIWTEWPSTARWAIGLLVGIDMIFSGWSLVMLALAARGIARNRA